jgi:hypothetical protein
MLIKLPNILIALVMYSPFYLLTDTASVAIVNLMSYMKTKYSW